MVLLSVAGYKHGTFGIPTRNFTTSPRAARSKLLMFQIAVADKNLIEKYNSCVGKADWARWVISIQVSAARRR